MRCLAVDYGFRRVGLAICDPSETFVSPVSQLTVEASRPGQVLEELGKLIREHEVEQVVVGLPLNMDGTEGDQAKATREFARKLGEFLGVEVHMQDERLSSSAADELLQESGLSRQQKKQRRDMLAACDILRDYLDQRRMG